MQEKLDEFYKAWNYFAKKLEFKLYNNTQLRVYDKYHFPLSHFILERTKTEH